MKHINIIYLAIFFFQLGCSAKKDSIGGAEPDSLQVQRNKEAREDSAEMAEALSLQSRFENVALADFETEPVTAGSEDDAADDPAFWLNVANPDSSIIFGTNKKGGIYAYDLQGRELNYYPVGMINNIDVRQQVKVGGKVFDLLGGSNRSDNSVVLYSISKNGTLASLLPENFAIDTTELDEVYGFCLYKNSASREFSAFINGKNGRINQYAVAEEKDGYSLKLKNHWETGSQPEGMVADDDKGYLYVGEEEKGIWKIGIEENNKSEITIIADSQKDNNKAIEYDLEGLAIYYGDNGSGFIVASVQGNFSYAIFDRNGNNRHLTSFVVKNGEVDGIEETDGLEIYSYKINDQFPYGMFIAQDGFNYDGQELKSQNFKGVDLGKILFFLDGKGVVGRKFIAQSKTE